MALQVIEIKSTQTSIENMVGRVIYHLRSSYRQDQNSTQTNYQSPWVSADFNYVYGIVDVSKYFYTKLDGSYHNRKCQCVANAVEMLFSRLWPRKL